MPVSVKAITTARGLVCPGCAQTSRSVFKVRSPKAFQRKACRDQTSPIAGTLFQSTRLPPTVWFLAIYLIHQAKTGLSALALKRYVEVIYSTAWLIQHKFKEAMSERETQYSLSGRVQLDDANFGGELNGGNAGRRPENNASFVATLSLDEEGQPLRVKLTSVSGFILKFISDRIQSNQPPGCTVLSGWLACFPAVTEAGCHQASIVGGRKPEDGQGSLWIHTIPGNFKTSPVVLIIFLNSQNTPRAIWRFLMGSSVARGSIRSRFVFSKPLSPSGLARMLGFGELKHLANQVFWTTDRTGPRGYNNRGSLQIGDASGNYTNSFGGASSVCPGTAGAAALVLSVDPDLLWQ